MENYKKWKFTRPNPLVRYYTSPNKRIRIKIEEHDWSTKEWIAYKQIKIGDTYINDSFISLGGKGAVFNSVKTSIDDIIRRGL